MLLFENFHKIESYEAKRHYLASLVTVGTIEQREHFKNIKKHSKFYFVQVRMERLRVCRKFFLETFSIGKKYLELALRCKSATNTVVGDRRGKHEPSNKFPPVVLQHAISHIKLFPHYSSYYSRAHTKKRYLHPDLNVSEMYTLYKEQCTKTAKCPISYPSYHSIFKDQNLSFKHPYSDTCKKCDMLNIQLKNKDLNQEERECLSGKKQRHLIKAENAYNQNAKDKEIAKQSNGTIVVKTLDLQKVLDTPLLTTCVSFHKRLLSTYNLTVHNLVDNQPLCYVWDETIASRGSDEIASALYADILSLSDDCKHLIYYSDNCSAQNHNFTLPIMYHTALKIKPMLTVIEHKFLEVGHTHMECDCDHARIEKAKPKEMSIFTPREWCQMIRMIPSKKGKKFKVIEMTNQNFYSFKTLYTTSRSHYCKKSNHVNGDKLKWKKIRILILGSTIFAIMLLERSVGDTSVRSVNCITLEEVNTAIKSLKMSYSGGINYIPNVIYILLVNEISQILVQLYNMILDHHYIPQSWKVSKVIPIHKKGDKHIIDNYRPISLVPVISKIFEKIIKRRMMMHLEMNQLLCKEQHGFRPGASTATNLMAYNRYIQQSLQHKSVVHCLYLDFSKAFDKVSHYLLLQKMRDINIPATYIATIRSYLQDRYQYVNYKNCNSSLTFCGSGVPQGSVLGPLLFNIFINDSVKCLKYCKALLYADDVKLYLQVPLNECNKSQAIIQHDLDNFSDWSTANHLILSADKCCCMIISGKMKMDDHQVTPPYFCNNTALNCVKEHSDLGVIFESSGTFGKHINKIINKSHKANAVIKRRFYFADVNVRLLLYKAFIRSNLEYCTAIWSPSKVTEINMIEAIQRKYTKGLCHEQNLDYSQRLKALQLISLENRRKYYDVCFGYKLLHGMLTNINLDDLHIQTHSEGRRAGSMLAKMSVSRRLDAEFSYRLINNWNEIPAVARDSYNYELFAKNVLKLYLR